MFNHRPIVPHVQSQEIELLPTTVHEVLPPDHEMGKQLTEQYHKAVSGIIEVLKFGAMMMALKNSVQGSLRVKSGPRGGRPKGCVNGWLAFHCPEVKVATAYRFLDVAESIALFAYAKAVGHKTANQIPFHYLATTPADKLPLALARKQQKLFDYVRGTSQRSWLDQFKQPRFENGHPNNHVKCKHCGADLKSKMVPFCRHCGAALVDIHTTVADLERAALDAAQKEMFAPPNDDAAFKRIMCLPSSELNALAAHRKALSVMTLEWASKSEHERQQYIAEWFKQEADKSRQNR